MRIRLLAAAAVLVSAWVHLSLWQNGVRTVPVIGPAFLINAVAGVAIAALLVLWHHRFALLLAAGFGASTLGAFVISATVGLFGVHEQWVGMQVWAAAISETVAILTGLIGCWHESRASRADVTMSRPMARVRL